MIKKLVGRDGYLYYGEMGEELANPESTEVGTWYKIKAIAATASITPKNAVVGDVFKAIAAEALGDGDILIPFTLTKIAFVTDVSNSNSKEKVDVTTQVDEYKSYRVGKRVDSTGTFNGYFTLGDPIVEQIVNEFAVVTTVGAGTKLETQEVKSETYHFFLSRNETSEVGETEVWEYKPCVFDSLTADKPMDSAQPFTANYSMVGSERPCTFIRKITA